MTERSTFGGELRRRRVAAGFSLTQMERILHYSKGYLSKIETGVRTPSLEFARRADVALDANGALAALVPLPDPEELDEPDEDPAMLNRRAVLALGGALLLPLEVRQSDAEAAADDDETERYFREQFDQCRALGQHSPPGFVLRRIAMELCTLQELVEVARDPRSRDRLSMLAARFAEYAGWMTQEAGNNSAALQWTRESARLAGDSELSAYALVREAELAMYAHDPMTTVTLARQALIHPRSTERIRGLAAHRQAQGHALLGDYDSCRAALDEADALLAVRAANGPGGPVLGSTVSELCRAVAGWCFYDLGRPRPAAEALEVVLASTPETSRRARALYGARLALAYEATGDLDRMCEVGLQVLAKSQALGSATVRGELRDLARTVLRRHHYKPALELHAEINAALNMHR